MAKNISKEASLIQLKNFLNLRKNQPNLSKLPKQFARQCEVKLRFTKSSTAVLEKL